MQCFTRKPCYRKDDRAMRSIAYGCSENFWVYLMNVPAKVEVRIFTRSWDNSGYLKNFGQSLDTPFKVTQGPRSWFWYQSKARVWLPISP